jgi:hypothetical protein
VASILLRLSAPRALLLDDIATIRDRLTAARATNLDRLDASVTSRLASIKATYRGTISIVAGVAENSVTIPAIDTAKSQLRFLGYTAVADAVSSSNPPAMSTRIELTNSTTIKALRSSTIQLCVAGYDLSEYN